MSLPCLRFSAPCLPTDIELLAQNQTPLLSKVNLCASEESYCAVDTGIATPTTFSRTHLPRVLRERVSVCVPERTRGSGPGALGTRGWESLACSGQWPIRPAGAWPSPGGFGELGHCSRGWAVAACSRRAAIYSQGSRRPAHLPAPLPSPPAICRLSAIVSSRAWRPGRHPRGPGA